MHRPLLLAVTVLSCAHMASAPVAVSASFPGYRRTLTEQGEELSSPEVQLQWDGDGWRGRAFGRSVELDAVGDRLQGTFEARPVAMAAQRSDEALRLTGQFGSGMSDVRIDATKLSGRIGRCGYELRSKDGVRYSGYRSCGGMPEQSAVSIEALGQHPLTPERVGPLLVLLSR